MKTKIENAVSPTISVMLLVLLTALIAIIVYVFIYGIPGGLEKSAFIAAEAGVVESNGTEYVAIQHRGGDDVFLNGSGAARGIPIDIRTTAAGGGSVLAGADYPITWKAGQVLYLYNTAEGPKITIDRLTAAEGTGFPAGDLELVIIDTKAEVRVFGSTLAISGNGRESTFHMLTLEAEPVRGGSVAGEGNYSHSAEIPIIATQYEGYRFVNWTEAGEEISIDSNFTYTMPDRDVSLIAYFEPGHIPVTYSAYWPLDEGTGAIASDRAGSYDGSVINPKWIQCQDRGYLLFDGTSYVNIEGNPNLKPVSAVSFETWVYPTEYRTAKVIQMRDWDGHGLDLNLWKGWQGGVNHGPGAKTTIDWAPSDANRRPDLFTWYHMALVYDNATLKLYVDGVLEKSQPLTGALHIWSFNPPIRIGSEGGQKFFKGSIANVGYSTDAFTATEIAARAANPPGGCPPEVHFTAVPAHGQIPLTVSFTDTSTRMPYAWSWSFGDGNTSTEQNPVHTYENAGTYTVTLQATNIFGTASSTQEYYIHAEGVVEPGNLLINPSFLGTVGLRPDSWQGTSRITSEAVNGNNIVMDASDGGGFLRQSVDDIDTDKAYTLSFYAKKNGTINSGWSQLAFYDDGGMYIGACVIVHNFADVLQDDWQKLEGTCHTIPANTGSIRVEIVRGLSTTGTDALFVHSPALVTA